MIKVVAEIVPEHFLGSGYSMRLDVIFFGRKVSMVQHIPDHAVINKSLTDLILDDAVRALKRGINTEIEKSREGKDGR